MVKLPIVDQMISLVRKPGTPPLPGALREAALMKRMLGGDAGGYRIEKRIIEKRGKYRDVEVLCAIAGSDDGSPFLVYVVDERARTAQGQIRPAAQSSEQL